MKCWNILLGRERRLTWFNTDRSLVSPRVRIILSNPEQSKILAEAVRSSRKSNTKVNGVKVFASGNIMCLKK